MKLVIVESPYKGNVKENIQYAKEALLDSLKRGESPIASHLLYTQVLDDDIKEERHMGINAGIAWYKKADLCVLYADNGFSEGMRMGIKKAKEYNVPIEIRKIK